MSKNETAAVRAKRRGLKISLTQVSKLKAVGYTRWGLQKMFRNPNDINHEKFDRVIDKAIEICKKIY